MTMNLPVSPDRFGTTSQPLNIAMVAPPWYELPPTGYGGIESVVADLVDGLSARGHTITLIGAGRHRTRASRFVPVFDEPPSLRIGEPMPEVLHAAAAAEVIDDLAADLVHDHCLAGPLTARCRTTPTIVTAHGPVTGEPGEYLHRLGNTIELVSISNAQQRLNPALNWVGTVYNAIDVNTFPFREVKGDFVLFIGRFNPDKAPHLAIDAAQAAGRRIVLAGKVSEPAEKAYFEAQIAPRLGRDVTYVGQADANFKRELFAEARCLLFPVRWDEPFGMVMIEAMACGTPVVAFRRGSVPEVVADGVSGIIVDTPEELPAAIEAAERLSPAACRAHVQANFDVPAMTIGYENVYTTLVGRRELAGRR
ncbi:glycosyltransferase family 4 protein [Streptomyces sp. NPDC005917]|uniref:glycosyltransferase family 4 protein n=1 Tax=unclassified Streptomyces TaxID=2593676 RepID=UPI0033F7D6BC